MSEPVGSSVQKNQPADRPQAAPSPLWAVPNQRLRYHRLRWDYGVLRDDTDVQMLRGRMQHIPGRRSILQPFGSHRWRQIFPGRLIADISLNAAGRTRIYCRPGDKKGWRSLLPGPVAMAALVQRGALVMHGLSIQAVDQGGGVMLVVGPSGIGKSTLAMALAADQSVDQSVQQRTGQATSLRVLGDDAAPCVLQDGRLELLPGMVGPRRWLPGKSGLDFSATVGWRPVVAGWQAVKWQGADWSDPGGSCPLLGVILLARGSAKEAPSAVATVDRLAAVLPHIQGSQVQRRVMPGHAMQLMAALLRLPVWRVAYEHSSIGLRAAIQHVTSLTVKAQSIAGC